MAPNHKTGERAERAAEVVRLRAQGLRFREIGEQLGISTSYASTLAHDPDGSKQKARRHRYGGTCVDCGKPTSGEGGTKRKKPTRCQACHTKFVAAGGGRREPVWPRERILEAIRWWAAEYGDGEPPAMNDFNPTNLQYNVLAIGRYKRAYRLVRVEKRVPWFAEVVRVFGSWNKAIEEAGFTPRPAHGSREHAMRRWR